MKEIIIVADYTEEATLTAADVCENFNIDLVLLREYIAYDIVAPQGGSPEEWTFALAELKRLRTAIRLQRDLEINPAGVALVMQLLAEMADLRQISTLYHRHLLK